MSARTIVTCAACVGVSIGAACCAAVSDGAIAPLLSVLAAAAPVVWVFGCEPARAAVRAPVATREGAARAAHQAVPSGARRLGSVDDPQANPSSLAVLLRLRWAPRTVLATRSATVASWAGGNATPSEHVADGLAR